MKAKGHLKMVGVTVSISMKCFNLMGFGPLLVGAFIARHAHGSGLMHDAGGLATVPVSQKTERKI